MHPSVVKSLFTRWDFRGKEVWNVGVSLEHYHCQLIIARDTRVVQVSDTVEFCHHYLSQPTLTHTDRILHGMNTLLCALMDAPTVACNAQLRAITELRYLFQQWVYPSQSSTAPLQPIHHKSHSCTAKLGNVENGANIANLLPCNQKLTHLPHLQGCTTRKWLQSFQG